MTPPRPAPAPPGATASHRPGPPPGRRLRSGLVVAAVAALPALLWRAGRMLPDERTPWPLAVADVAAPVALLPLALVAALGALGAAATALRSGRAGRRSLGAAVAAPALLALLGAPLAAALPPVARLPPTPYGPPVLVVAWNARGDAGGVAALLEAARRDGVDLVLLSEIPDGLARSSAALAWPHRAVQPGRFGNAILSRVPLEDVRTLEGNGTRGPLAARARFAAAFAGGGVDVVAAHAPWPFAARPSGIGERMPDGLLATWDATARDAYLADLAAFARAAPGPVLIGGDLNLSPWEAAYAIPDGPLDDAGRDAGPFPGATWPADRDPLPPFLRIDQIWVGGGLHAERVTLGDARGSDHRPVFARLRFEPFP